MRTNSTAIRLGISLLLLTVLACAEQPAAPTPVTAPPERSTPLAPTPTSAEIEVATPVPASVPLPTSTPAEIEVATPTPASVILAASTLTTGGTEVVTPTPTSVPLSTSTPAEIGIAATVPTGVPIPTPTPTTGETEIVTRTPTSVPIPTSVPALEGKVVQTPADTGYNTRVVDGDIHVWHAPDCPRINSAEWVAPIILTDLRSGSYLYLNQDGTVSTSPEPDYRSDEGRERFAEVLEDGSLMELIIAPFECPEPVAVVPEPKFCGGLDGWPDPDAVDIGEPPVPRVGISHVDSLGGYCMGHGWTGSYCWPAGVKGRTCQERDDWNELTGAETYGMTMGSQKALVTVLGDESSPGRVTRIQLFPVIVEEPEFELGQEAYSLDAHEGENITLFELPDVSEGIYLLITKYESPLGEVEHGFKIELRNRRVKQ